MNWMNIARIAKVVALAGFLMPWLLVSCQGQEVASATGWQMAIGEMDALGDAATAQEADPAWWAILSLLLILGGLAASVFVKPLKRGAMALTGAAAAAFLLCAVGMNLAISSARAEASQPEPGADPMAAQMQAAVADAIRFDIRYGYWLTLAGLFAATAAGGLAWQGRTLRVAAPRTE